MTSRTKIITTLFLLVFLVGLGVTDYYLSSGDFTASVDQPSDSGANSSSLSSKSSATVAANSSVAAVTGVKKQNGPDVKLIIESNGFTTAKSDSLSFIAQVSGSGAEVHTFALLQNGDRAGSITWIESGDVKNQFIALKEALLKTFSPQVKDLKDETLQGNDLPVRNQLSFFDPTLSAERLSFVRVRERLFEFHITAGKEVVMQKLIEAVTTK